MGAEKSLSENAEAHKERASLLQIFVDADACPVKQEVYRVAKRCGLPVTLVANSWMRIPPDPSITLHIVAATQDSADDWIAGHVESHDIVVTADIPLANRCLKAGARVISTTGNRSRRTTSVSLLPCGSCCRTSGSRGPSRAGLRRLRSATALSFCKSWMMRFKPRGARRIPARSERRADASKFLFARHFTRDIGPLISLCMYQESVNQTATRVDEMDYDYEHD